MKREENQKTKIVKEFSRFAHKYNIYNIIQAEVARLLIKTIPSSQYIHIVDIGCGSGEVYKNMKKSNVSFKHFIALDSSQEMLALHPSGKNIKKICDDFNNLRLFKHSSSKEDTLIVSSSALQWSKDLNFTLAHLSKRSANAYFAIFTSGTFKTLHKTAQIDSPIYSTKILKQIIQKYYHATFKLKKYDLKFETTREMFKYIKKSGVSGGERQLNYKQTKYLMQNYPLEYLEFEVLFVKGVSKSENVKSEIT